ncbi:glycosyltransferase family 2 protein [Candidatus Curtissbacteria bacterium]|nr:glycosyltransferase family 2 protein [Candidatus Curtissbacteria bacterium]
MAAKPNLNSKPSISVFFPCYNDAGSIGLLVEDANNLLKRLAGTYEIIVIDDASKDESRKILKRLKAKIPRLNLVFHKENMGYGGALKSGFKNAKYEWVFYTDGDGQYDVKELEKLIELISKKVDVIQGYKIKRSDPSYRLVIGRTYHYFSTFLFNLKIKDVDCDFRLVRKKALDDISLKYNSGVICVELVKKLQDRGYRFVETGVHHYPRLYGHSQFFNYKRIMKTLFELAELWISLQGQNYEKQ